MYELSKNNSHLPLSEKQKENKTVYKIRLIPKETNSSGITKGDELICSLSEEELRSGDWRQFFFKTFSGN